MPTTNSQLKHIFRKAEGHLPDTPANRSLLEGTAANKNNLLGVDKYGNSWYAQIRADGSQVWIQARNGIITNGGVNAIPKVWNAETGLKTNITLGK